MQLETIDYLVGLYLFEVKLHDGALKYDPKSAAHRQLLRRGLVVLGANSYMFTSGSGRIICDALSGCVTADEKWFVS